MQMQLVTTILDYPFIKSPTAVMLYIAIAKHNTAITKKAANTVATLVASKSVLAILIIFMLPPLLSQQTVCHT